MSNSHSRSSRSGSYSLAAWVRLLDLQPHPEGGFYRETYRSAGRFPLQSNGQFPSNRPISTAILYLLPGSEFSAFHRIRSDELWHFHHGSDLLLHTLTRQGSASIRLGPDPATGARLQVVIPAGVWFAARVIDSSAYALVSCTMSPGFEYPDFELASRTELTHLFPGEQVLIESLTR